MHVMLHHHDGGFCHSGGGIIVPGVILPIPLWCHTRDGAWGLIPPQWGHCHHPASQRWLLMGQHGVVVMPVVVSAMPSQHCGGHVANPVAALHQ